MRTVSGLGSAFGAAADAVVICCCRWPPCPSGAGGDHDHVACQPLVCGRAL